MSNVELIEAVKSEEPGPVKTLIEAGTDVNQQDKHEWTPLSWAAAKGNVPILTLLLENGADPFKTGRDLRTPAMIALAAGRIDAARLLREAEAKLKGADYTPPERKYCLACHLKGLRQFPAWTENTLAVKTQHSNGHSPETKEAEQSLSDESIVYLHHDYTVTRSIWHNEDVIFNRITQEWKDFCSNTLDFHVPDDVALSAAVASQ